MTAADVFERNPGEPLIVFGLIRLEQCREQDGFFFSW